MKCPEYCTHDMIAFLNSFGGKDEPRDYYTARLLYTYRELELTEARNIVTWWKRQKTTAVKTT